MERHDYDSPWKDIVNAYFQQFLEFFFPAAAEDIDWSRPYIPLDKELRQISREAEIRTRLVDALFKVWKKNGEEIWALIHVEIQAQRQADFAHRTYIYNYRLHDLYQQAVASFAILADSDAKWRPSRYAHELWGCRTTFRFPVVKLLSYRRKLKALQQSHNPFAIVVLAHLKTLATRDNTENRRRWKFRVTKNLYQRGFSRTEILNLYRFIDWIMVLPDELERQYHRDLMQFEEEQRMQYITTAERIGMEKGMEKGTLIGEIVFAQRLLNMTTYSQHELEAKSLADLREILSHFEAELAAKHLLPAS